MTQTIIECGDSGSSSQMPVHTDDCSHEGHPRRRLSRSHSKQLANQLQQKVQDFADAVDNAAEEARNAVDERAAVLHGLGVRHPWFVKMWKTVSYLLIVASLVVMAVESTGEALGECSETPPALLALDIVSAVFFTRDYVWRAYSHNKPWAAASTKAGYQVSTSAPVVTTPTKDASDAATDSMCTPWPSLSHRHC